MLAGAGIIIAILSFYASALAPGLVASAGVLSTLVPHLRSNKNGKKKTSFSGALIAMAWALARHNGVKYIEYFGPIMLLADYRLEWSASNIASDIKQLFGK